MMCLEDYTNNIAVENDPKNEANLATFLAFHLVSQVLDEAYIIANAAKESGQPWRYVNILKNLRSGKTGDPDDECLLFMNLNLNQDKSIVELNYATNLLATSTPQKPNIPSVHSNTPDTYIGQGDVDIELLETDLSKATSMFINNLFDMSEVEFICDETSQETKRITNSILRSDSTEEFDKSCNVGELKTNVNDDSFAITEVVDVYENVVDVTEKSNHEDMGENYEQNMELEGNRTVVKDQQVFCENAYLTLNCDFDVNSEEDIEPILQDPKALTMDEIELLKADDTEDDLSRTHKMVSLNATSAVSSSSKKNKLVQRCRTSGSRLITCLRGWWRKRVLRRGESTKNMHAPCSPDPQRRYSSLRGPRNIDYDSTAFPKFWNESAI